MQDIETFKSFARIYLIPQKQSARVTQENFHSRVYSPLYYIPRDINHESSTLIRFGNLQALDKNIPHSELSQNMEFGTQRSASWLVQ